ncbi:MAG: ATP-dependent helicase HrpB, partial [Sphingomonas bacterium]|nr:ATP-dependent helicase HrpB [Sphingomonas bacterium]
RWLGIAGVSGSGGGQGDVGACVALAFPDRVARRRGADGADWLAVGGRGFRLDPASPLAREQWLAVAEVQGSAAGARILSASPIAQATIEALFADRIGATRSITFDPATGGIQAVRERRLGALRLTGGADDSPDPAAIAAALVDGVRRHGLDLLGWPEAARRLRARSAFAAAQGGREDPLADEALLATLDEWLPPLVHGRRRLSDISGEALMAMLDGRIGWDGRQAIDRLAPDQFVSPAGSHHAIDYEGDGAPAVEVRVQALFGLSVHPLAGATPLLLRLTSPAGRPIQTTRDLPGFWAGSWTAVAKEMRGRYPRHPWPEDPARADPTLRTKKAAGR